MFFLQKKSKSKKTSCLPLSDTYSRAFSNIKNILQCHWHLLQKDPELQETFQQTQIVAFHRNQNVMDAIGCSNAEANEVKQKFLTIAKTTCPSCLSNKKTLCCRQIIKTATFQSNQKSCMSKYTI